MKSGVDGSSTGGAGVPVPESRRLPEVFTAEFITSNKPVGLVESARARPAINFCKRAGSSFHDCGITSDAAPVAVVVLVVSLIVL
jgi:hypothetical protein